MKEILAWILLIIGGLLCIYPLIYWFQNPELTKMQLFIEQFDIYVPGIILAALGYFIILNDNDN